MTEAVRSEPSVSFSVILFARHDPVARIFNVDLLTVLIAVVLPWSTSGVAIVAVLWIIALIPTLELRAFLRSLTHPISALPIALFALALVGTLWSDASWSVRLLAVGPTAKLLVLPLLLYHFERSPRGAWVFVAFLASCTLLMAVSWVVAFDPELTLKPEAQERGIFVKNYIDQSQEFTLCVVALAYPITMLLRTNRILPAALLAAIALGFVANMMFVVVSRTALVTMPIMLAAFALLHLKSRTILIASCVAAVLAAVVWNASPELRATVSKFFTDYQKTKMQNNPTGIGSRLEFWQKSLQFFADAPVIGHGTGSMRGLFEEAAIGQTGVGAEIVRNPHNQTLNVAVQWGAIGVMVLYAMWALHLLLFRGDGLSTWVGLLVVVQNIFSSLFNSHLFDFHEGWMYVLGVGVAGGMTRGARPAVRADSAAVARLFWKILVGFAILACFFGVWFLPKYFTRSADSPLDRETKLTMAALREYRVSRGSYPVLPIADNLLVDLKKDLAKGGFLRPESGDLSGPDKEARYVSYNGKVYGLLFHEGRSDGNPSGTCLIEVGVSNTGWWGQQPKCRFQAAACAEPFAIVQHPACWNGLAWRR